MPTPRLGKLGFLKPAIILQELGAGQPPFLGNTIYTEIAPRKKQWGAVDLTVNVALLAFAAGVVEPVGRAAMVVNQPWKKIVQVEQTINIAARLPIQQTLTIGKYVEPTFTKRIAAAPDISPNIAARVTIASVPLTPKNVIEPTVTKRPPLQVNVWPNVAANVGTETSPVIRQPLYTPYKTLHAQQPLLYPNLSTATVVAQPFLRFQAEPVIWRSKWQTPEIFPNLVVTAFSGDYTINSSDDTYVKRPPQIDAFPNLAVRVAAQVETPRVPAPNEPTLAKRYAPQIDVYRNNALLAPVEVSRVPTPIEPTLANRYAPQVDVYRNNALLSPVETFRPAPFPVEPWIAKRYAPPVITYPNMAVNFDSNPCHCVFPIPGDVRAGVIYGPTGIEYTGTLVVTVGGGGSYMRRR